MLGGSIKICCYLYDKSVTAKVTPGWNAETSAGMSDPLS